MRNRFVELFFLQQAPCRNRSGRRCSRDRSRAPSRKCVMPSARFPSRHQRHPEVVVGLGIARDPVPEPSSMSRCPLQAGPCSSGPKPRRKAGTTRPRARRSSSCRPGGYSRTPGIFTARLAAVELSIRMAGLSLPSLVEVRQVHLRVGRTALRGEHQPTAVGREAVPGVHQGRIASHTPRHAAFRGHNVELAVGAHQLPVACISRKTIQRPSGETLGKVLLMPLWEAPSIGTGWPPLPSLKGMR